MVMKQAITYGGARWADMSYIAKKFEYKIKKDFFLGRNPYVYNEAIGVSNDRHIFLCAGTRAGKGRSIIIPNLLHWPGSIVAVDPKGENASITAEYRDSIGQDTYVLDPYGMSDVPDRLRASCNLLDVLDTKSGNLLSECANLAEAMRVSQGSGESEQWSKGSAEITKLVIAHVATSSLYESDERNLVTVRNLLRGGAEEQAAALKLRRKEEIELAIKEGREPKVPQIPDNFELLLLDMTKNPAERGILAQLARNLLDLKDQNERQFGSLLKGSRDETGFIDDLAMEYQLSLNAEGRRPFKISELVDNPNGISLYISLPDKPSHPAVRWQKVLITLLLDEMYKLYKKQEPPANGERVLMVLDEFASMGRMDSIADGMNSVAGTGVTLFVIVTNLGDLEALYGTAWQKIPAGCGTQIFFQNDDLKTGEYIEKLFGETEVRLLQRTVGGSISEGTSFQTTSGVTFTGSETYTDGDSTSQSTSKSFAQQVGHNQSISINGTDTWQTSEGTNESSTRGENSSWSINRSFSQGKGVSSSTNAQVDGLFGPHIVSTNDGESMNKGFSKGNSWGGGKNKSLTFGRNKSSSIGGSTSRGENYGTNESQSNTHGTTEGTTVSKSFSRAQSFAESNSIAEGETYSEQVSYSFSESIQKRPLISIPEINVWFATVIGQQDDPAYPGYGLVRISGENPFVIRKCNYDQDILFYDPVDTMKPLFRVLPKFEKTFVPKPQQWLTGGEYTPDHYVPVRVPIFVTENDIPLEITIEHTTNEYFEINDPLFTWRITEPGLNTQQTCLAPLRGKVIDCADVKSLQDKRDIMLLRFEQPLNSGNRVWLEQKYFKLIDGYINNKKALVDLKRAEDRAKQAEAAKVRKAEIEKRLAENEEFKNIFWPISYLAFWILPLFTIAYCIYLATLPSSYGLFTREFTTEISKIHKKCVSNDKNVLDTWNWPGYHTYFCKVEEPIILSNGFFLFIVIFPSHLIIGAIISFVASLVLESRGYEVSPNNLPEANKSFDENLKLLLVIYIVIMILGSIAYQITLR